MIGIEGKPYKSYDNIVDIDFLSNNELNVHTAIANSKMETWGLTGGRLDIWPYDEVHKKLLAHKGVKFDLSSVKDKQMFEQLHFKIYNVGSYICLKLNGEYINDYYHYWSFMDKWISTLPFSYIDKIIVMVLPAGTQTLIHRDPPAHNFIYFRPNLDKKFFIYDENTNTKHYVNSLAAEWSWDDYHGTETMPFANYAIKISGDLSV